MALLFVSYRVASAAPHAGRLYDRLAAHFGEAAIFYDRGSLSAGELWQDRLRRELDESAAVLAMIDPSWATSFDTQANREDIVRFELETAIRLGKTIVPLLVGGATSPLREELPATLRAVLDHHCFPVDETSVAGYAASMATLVGMLESLEGVVAAVEPAVVELLVTRDYDAAERLVMRQPSAARQRATLCVYLALARLAGRSFNALSPAERETIETLLRRARATSHLSMLLLAILEIDYYELHGLVSAAPVRPAEVRSGNGAAALDAKSRSILASVHVSRRARRELQLDAVLLGAGT